MKILLSSLLVTSALLATDDMRIRNLGNRISSLENSQNRCWTVNPPARPFTSDGLGFYLSIAPILWQANTTSFPLSVKTSDGSTLFDSSQENRVHNFSFDWSFGLRLGVGVHHLHDSWDTLAQWTHFQNQAETKISQNQNNPVITVEKDPTLYPKTTSPSSNYHLDYDLIDLCNGRQFYISKCITLRPFAGLRMAWINQTLQSCFLESNISKSDQTFGVGIRGGIDMQWGLGNHFALFSNYAANLLHAYHNLEQKQERSEEMKIESFYHIGMVIHDMQLGFCYNWLSQENCYHLGFDLGWEIHFHPGQNQGLNFTDTEMPGKYFASQGDLEIQGLFAKFRFDF